MKQSEVNNWRAKMALLAGHFLFFGPFSVGTHHRISSKMLRIKLLIMWNEVTSCHFQVLYYWAKCHIPNLHVIVKCHTRRAISYININIVGFTSWSPCVMNGLLCVVIRGVNNFEKRRTGFLGFLGFYGILGIFWDFFGISWIFWDFWDFLFFLESKTL